MIEMRLMKRFECFRRMLNSVQHSSTKTFQLVDFFPSFSPRTYTKSSVRMNGDLSRLIMPPAAFFTWPKKWPKSMWNKCPSSLIMTLSLCRSAIPSTYVATQHPAQERRKLSVACGK